jgi:hypothetical protein
VIFSYLKRNQQDLFAISFISKHDLEQTAKIQDLHGIKSPEDFGQTLLGFLEEKILRRFWRKFLKTFKRSSNNFFPKIFLRSLDDF